MKSCLFVDFDNAYTNLEKGDVNAADAFAAEPSTWVDWLLAAEHERRFLVKVVYLNPAAHYRARSAFVRAGFQVVDTPSLTQQGKSNADIRIAIDMLDALAHPAHYDEFVLFSGDSDFAPILLRLRANDRCTAIMCASFTSQAYRACADTVINTEDFMREALGYVPRAEQNESDAPRSEALSAPQNAPQNVAIEVPLLAMARAMLAEAQVRPISPLSMPRFFQMYPGFRGSSWFGYKSLRRLVEAIIAASAANGSTELRIVDVSRTVWQVEAIEAIVDAPPVCDCPFEGGVKFHVQGCQQYKNALLNIGILPQ